MITNSPLADARLESVLSRLHARDKRQFLSIVRHYLPRMLLTPFIGQSAIDTSTPAEAEFLRDKLVALDPEKGQLAYSFCRALDSRLVVEVGASFGVSTLYLAAALRDNVSFGGGKRRVISTEIEPAKAIAARLNWAEAGLDTFIELREGDALETLADVEEPIDFVLIDTWIPIALPALKLLVPRLRPGAIVMCDNVKQCARAYRNYTDYVRNPGNGFRSMLWPGQGGTEISVWSQSLVQRGR